MLFVIWAFFCAAYLVLCIVLGDPFSNFGRFPPHPFSSVANLRISEGRVGCGEGDFSGAFMVLIALCSFYFSSYVPVLGSAFLFGPSVLQRCVLLRCGLVPFPSWRSSHQAIAPVAQFALCHLVLVSRPCSVDVCAVVLVVSFVVVLVLP